MGWRHKEQRGGLRSLCWRATSELWFFALFSSSWLFPRDFLRLLAPSSRALPRPPSLKSDPVTSISRNSDSDFDSLILVAREATVASESRSPALVFLRSFSLLFSLPSLLPTTLEETKILLSLSSFQYSHSLSHPSSVLVPGKLTVDPACVAPGIFVAGRHFECWPSSVPEVFSRFWAILEVSSDDLGEKFSLRENSSGDTREGQGAGFLGLYWGMISTAESLTEIRWSML